MALTSTPGSEKVVWSEARREGGRTYPGDQSRHNLCRPANRPPSRNQYSGKKGSCWRREGGKEKEEINKQVRSKGGE